jgi:hypothetical protein
MIPPSLKQQIRLAAGAHDVLTADELAEILTD